MQNYVSTLETQLEVINYFEDWLLKDCDRGDSADANYERFLEDSAAVWFDCPVDSEEYFIMRSYIYAELDRQIKLRHEN